jgi:hypothetical protein
LKKPTGSVWFYKPKTEPKPEKTEPNQFEPVFVLKNRTETSWFELILILFFNKKISSLTCAYLN